MTGRRTPFGRIALALALSVAFASPATAVVKRLNIGTGAVTGVYYAAGEAICRLVNRTSGKSGIRCRVDATPGSIANLDGLRSGRFDMAIVESNWLYRAWKGTDRFARFGPDTKLRSVLSLHHEAFTVLARPDSGIERFADIKGKRINVGNRGSGYRATVTLVFRALGWQLADFPAVREAGTADQSQMLCDNRVDATLFTIGHPNHAVADAIATCKAHLVPVEGERIAPGQPVPDNPIIPFIEGDGIGVDITPVMKAVVDAAVEKAYGGGRRNPWMGNYAGGKAKRG